MVGGWGAQFMKDKQRGHLFSASLNKYFLFKTTEDVCASLCRSAVLMRKIPMCVEANK